MSCLLFLSLYARLYHQWKMATNWICCMQFKGSRGLAVSFACSCLRVRITKSSLQEVVREEKHRERSNPGKGGRQGLLRWDAMVPTQKDFNLHLSLACLPAPNLCHLTPEVPTNFLLGWNFMSNIIIKPSPCSPFPICLFLSRFLLHSLFLPRIAHFPNNVVTVVKCDV